MALAPTTIDLADAAQLAAQVEGIERVADATAAQTERPISDDRRWIAQLVLYLFAGSTLAVIVATTVLALFRPDIWEATAKALLTIIAQVLLPVVTLVIGFYFRSDSR